MERKFVLLTKTDDGRAVCFRGEGTPSQIKSDLKKFKNPESLEIVPVIGGRFQKESLLAGFILGIGLGLIGMKVYAILRKRCSSEGRVSTGN